MVSETTLSQWEHQEDQQSHIGFTKTLLTNLVDAQELSIAQIGDTRTKNHTLEWLR